MLNQVGNIKKSRVYKPVNQNNSKYRLKIDNVVFTYQFNNNNYNLTVEGVKGPYLWEVIGVDKPVDMRENEESLPFLDNEKSSIGWYWNDKEKLLKIKTYNSNLTIVV